MAAAPDGGVAWGDDQTQSPLVGRDAERARLVRAAGDAAATRAAAQLAILGAAGTGKSRLVREATHTARNAGAEVLIGRAVPGPVPAPYRPLREALLAWERRGGTASSAYVDALQPVLTPQAQPTTEPLSPVFVGEALLRAVGERATGTVLVLEDLHWADAETLAVVEYVCDNSNAPGLLVVLTCRDEEATPARDLFKRLAVRRSVELFSLHALSPAQTVDLASALIGESRPHVLELVKERSEGIPLLVEELVAAVRARGGLEDASGPDPAFVPDSVSDAVDARLEQLNELHRQVVQAASILGRGIDWQQLVAVTGTDEQDVLEALRDATRRTLVQEDPERPGSLRFRHALIRDAVERSVFAPERVLVSGKALDVLLEDRQIEDLGEDELSTAYDLAVRSLRRELALRLAMRSADVALNGWALSTSERWLAEARRSADHDDVVGIDLANLRVASIVGRLDVVERLGRGLLARSDRLPDEAALEARLRLAAVTVDEARFDEAEEHLEEAFGLLSRVDDPCAVTRHEMYASAVALGHGDPELAARRAQRTIERALPRDDEQDLACFGYVLLGRAYLPDTDAARRAWEQGLQVAKDAGIRLWVAKMLAELATLTVPELEGDADLELAERRAYEAGAVEVAERVSLLRAELAMLQGRFDDAEHHLERAAEVSAGIVVALRTRQRALELPVLLAAMRSGLPDGLPVPAHERAVVQPLVQQRRVHAERIGGGAADDALRALVDVEPTDGRGLIPRAIARARRATDAEEFAGAVDELKGAPWFAAMLTWQLAGAFVEDEAVRAPLREAVATLDAFGLEPQAEACRAMLRQAGVPVPRRTADQAGVPDRLKALGVTAREMDVLDLVAQGLTSREIGERLYLSPRTVEKHVERLMVKTGSVNRAALATLATSARSTNT